MIRRTPLAWIGVLFCAPIHAADIQTLTVTHGDGNRYTVTMHAQLNARATDSHRVLNSVALLPKINDAIEHATTLPNAPAGAQRVHTRVRLCVWKFCARVNQVQDIRERPTNEGYALIATVLPERSNLRHGIAQWTLRDCGTPAHARTCLNFEAEIVPDFWIPPLIGPRVVERTLRREAIVTAQGIERLARTPAAP